MNGTGTILQLDGGAAPDFGALPNRSFRPTDDPAETEMVAIGAWARPASSDWTDPMGS